MRAGARAQSLDNVGPQEKRPLPELRGSGSSGVPRFLFDPSLSNLIFKNRRDFYTSKLIANG